MIGRAADLAGKVLWAFPPPELAGKVLAEIWEEYQLRPYETRATIVVPDWPERTWHGRFLGASRPVFRKVHVLWRSGLLVAVGAAGGSHPVRSVGVAAPLNLTLPCEPCRASGMWRVRAAHGTGAATVRVLRWEFPSCLSRAGGGRLRWRLVQLRTMHSRHRWLGPGAGGHCSGAIGMGAGGSGGLGGGRQLLADLHVASAPLRSFL